MVAIKAAHIQLTMKDLWPDALWTWERVHELKDQCRQKVIDSGETDYMKILFLTEREYMNYMNTMPSYADKQRILKSIYPEKKMYGMSLTEEEAQYLFEKLHGVNDGTGQDILTKIERMLSNVR